MILKVVIFFIPMLFCGALATAFGLSEGLPFSDIALLVGVSQIFGVGLGIICVAHEGSSVSGRQGIDK